MEPRPCVSNGAVTMPTSPKQPPYVDAAKPSSKFCDTFPLQRLHYSNHECEEYSPLNGEFLMVMNPMVL